LQLSGGYVFERLEMIGELAWAYWRLGDRGRASAAMSGLIRNLAADQRFGVPRYREVFNKAGHALGWMSSMAESGQPPTQTLQGQEYMEPFPGFFSASRPRIAEPGTPQRFDILFHQLGRLAEGFGLWALAASAFERGISSSPAGLPTVVTAMGQLELASYATLRRDYETALSLAISGVRTLDVAHKTVHHESALGTLTAPIDVTSNWCTRAKDDRHAAEVPIYWNTIGLVAASLLAADANPDLCAREISRLRAAFDNCRGDLADSDYWKDMLSELQAALSPLATRESLRGQIRATEDSHLLLLFRLALSRIPEESLEEICGSQAVAFEFIDRFGPAARSMKIFVCVHVCRYWRQVAREQGFALRTPERFREALKAFQRPTVKNASRLLLLAAEQTRTSLGAEITKRLLALAGIE
jgi:hypothetical protein